MTNDAVPSREALASITGVTQMAIIIPQGIAPAAATTLFAYSIESGILHGNLVWAVFFTFCEWLETMSVSCTFLIDGETSSATVGALQALTLQESKEDWR